MILRFIRVIITSATLDDDKLSKYFYNCPVLRIPGRVFPVDIYHSKAKQTMTISGPSNNSYIQNAVDTILKIHTKQEDGHILVFLTGQEEIEKACFLVREALKEDQSQIRDLLVLPLYASLTMEAQQRVFKKAEYMHSEKHLYRRNVGCGRYIRKCVIATNIAETSITVPQVCVYNYP